jgi:trehalose-6-phosphatase
VVERGETDLVRKSLFDRILRELQEIRYRLDDVEKSISGWKPESVEIRETDLLSLPDHLRKSYLVAASRGECNATQVSNLTGRCRAIESNYLNQLARAGWLTKRRDSKEILFLPDPRRATGLNDRRANTSRPRATNTLTPARRTRKFEDARQTMNVECLSTDYDGTISPLDVVRSDSHVPLETRVMLNQISKSLPILVITMKDLHFVMPRTPFARAWSAIGGLEMKIGKRVLTRESVESKLSTISRALDYARPRMAAVGGEIEEKQDSEGHTVAFCLDWRRAKKQCTAKVEAERIAEFIESLELRVLRYENQPFYDVCPVVPDKGAALQEALSELAVKNGVLYLGDSEADNAAFRNSGVSIGIIHGEPHLKSLECDYFIRFEDVPLFLKALIVHNFQFSSDFPMVKANPNRRNRRQSG